MEKPSISHTNEEYNNEPVFYCKKCLSLKILSINDTTDFCDECGSTEIEEAHIFEWNELYKNKYKKSYISNGK